MKKGLIKIVLVVVILALCVACCYGCNRRAKNNGVNTPTQQTDITDDTQDKTEPTDTQTPSQPNDGNEDPHGRTENTNDEPNVKTTAVVRFLNTDYSEISVQEIPLSGNAVAPKLNSVPAQTIFSGWDKPLDNIQDDTNFMPVYQNVSNVDNAIGFNTIYVSSGSEFDVDILIAGKVQFASTEMKLSYNGTAISVLDITPCAGYVAYHHNEEQCTINFSLASASNITGEMTLLRLHCRAEVKTTDSPLSISVTDLSITNEQGDILDGQYTLFNEKIIIQ